MIGLDTNVLVRYLVQDDIAQSKVATSFIEEKLSAEEPGFISLVVLCEIVWVLDGCYHLKNTQISSILETLLATKQLIVEQTNIAWAALKKFRSSKADFADAVIGQISKQQGCNKTVTFDKAAAKLEEFFLLK